MTENEVRMMKLLQNAVVTMDVGKVLIDLKDARIQELEARINRWNYLTISEKIARIKKGMGDI